MKKLAVSIFIFILMGIPTMCFAVSGDRVSLGYIYNVSTTHTQIVNQTEGCINSVSPTCLDLSTSGQLVVNEIFNQQFVEEMHAQGILVTPFLSNHWINGKAIAALNRREELANELVEAVEKYHFDGINVDLENVSINEKDLLTDFMRILREKLPKDKILSIAVGANPYGFTSSWVSAYDYENLAKYSDYLVLMSYDEHGEGGQAGPVASIEFVEQSVKAILEIVSRDKVVMGIPLYGRFWQQDESGDYMDGGEAIILSQIEKIASRYKEFEPEYNEETGIITLTIEVESGDQKAFVNGRYLDEGIYTIWYENEKSFEKKFIVMNQYGLKGAAFWAIGNEGENFWSQYQKAINDENYESEASIQQRIREEIYRKKVEELLKNVKYLVIEKRLKIDDRFEYDLTADKVLAKLLLKQEKDERIHEESEERQLEEPDYRREVVVLKEKPFKELDRITIVHIVKRGER